MSIRHEKTNVSKENKGNASISWRLFGILVVFVTAMLLIIWIFQVALLNKFYHKSKLDEFAHIRDAISECVDDKRELRKIVVGYSYKYDACVLVVKINDKREAIRVADSHISGTCLEHRITDGTLTELYAEAIGNGGEYIYEWQPQESYEGNDSTDIITIYVSALKADNGEEYAVMINSSMKPLNATVRTLENQFGWIALVLVIGALILAVIITKKVCKPLEKMGESAKSLAMGNYNVNFGGREYKEAQELADALNYASKELKKNDNLQKELVANISHDLRTPLTLIKGYAEVMVDIPDENTPENMKIIIDETERLTELVNDMLDLSKIKAGTRKPEKEVFNLTETVKEIMKRYKKLTEKDGYDISFNADEDVYIYADVTMMLQVIYNLVNNAVNYTGGDKKVVVTQSVIGDKVRISVKDSGQGIDVADLPYIWDRYYKVDKIHKRAQIGTGLGLSIVKGILEAHETSYGVESKMGEGSTFWFDMYIVKDVTVVEE